MIRLKQCSIKNWDGQIITPCQQIKDRFSLKLRYLAMVERDLQNRSINRRFHDEPKRVINELIRWCHGAMGMYASTTSGCLYLQQTSRGDKLVLEHTVPVADLVNLYFRNRSDLAIFLFFPVTLISQESDQSLRNFSKSNTDLKYPFRRYVRAGFQNDVVTHTGQKIDMEKFSMTDHLELVKNTADTSTLDGNSDYKEILDEFDVVNRFSFWMNVNLN